MLSVFLTRKMDDVILFGDRLVHVGKIVNAKIKYNELFANSENMISLQVRIGVHVGDIVAGVVGKKQPQYDIWGSACNIASRMESTAPMGQIQVSQQVVDTLKSSGYGDLFNLEKRRVSLKGIGRVDAFALQLDKEEILSLMQEQKKNELSR